MLLEKDYQRVGTSKINKVGVVALVATVAAVAIFALSGNQSAQPAQAIQQHTVFANTKLPKILQKKALNRPVVPKFNILQENTLSLDEVRAANANCAALTDSNWDFSNSWFARYDTNGDFVISSTEIVEQYGEDYLNYFLGWLDLNQDGEISIDENCYDDLQRQIRNQQYETPADTTTDTTSNDTEPVVSWCPALGE